MANAAIHIREANLPNDKPMILDFIFALQRHEAAFEANRRTDAQMAEEHYAALIPRAQAPKGKIFIAENADGLPIGWALIHDELGEVFVRAEERAHGFLAELYVVEASRAQGVGRFPGLQSSQLKLALHFFVVYGDVFSVGDAFQQHEGLHFRDGAVPLGSAQTGKVQLTHLFCVHALRRQGAQTTLQARVNLVLNQ